MTNPPPAPFRPFDAIAQQYDQEFTDTAIGKLQREVVMKATHAVIPENAGCLLELNCGTGADTCLLAARYPQLRIVSTDISSGMTEVTRHKVQQAGLENRVQVVTAGFDDIGQVQLPAAADIVFSNFGGLNCIGPTNLVALNQVLSQKMASGGLFIVVLLGRFCWWETLYFLLKGKWRTAFRRRSKGPIAARLDAQTTVDTWYYAPKEFAALFPDFKLTAVQPVGFWIPPSYLEPMFSRMPTLLNVLNRLEKAFRGSIWASAADHYWMVLKKH